MTIHYGLTVTASSVPVVATSDMKDFLRLASTETVEDTLVAGLVTAATRLVESATNRALLKHVYSWTLDDFPDSSTAALVVPVAPLYTVTSITSYDEDDTATVMSTSEYQVDTASEPGRITVKEDYDWPDDLRQHQAGVIVFTAGYSTAASGVPEPLTQAVKCYVAHLYEHRGDEVGTHTPDWDYPSVLPPLVRVLVQDYALPEWG